MAASSDVEKSKAGDAPVENTKNVSASESTTSLPESQRPPGDLRRRTRRERRKGPFVKYVGSASQRKITSPDWRSLAIDLKDDKADHVWDITNDFLVEADLFSDGQLDYLLIDDMQPGVNAHSFLLVDYDPDTNELVQAVYE